MGFYCVFADEEAGGDFAIAQAGGDQAQDFQFARGDFELGEAGLVEDEGFGGGRGWDFLDDGYCLFSGECEAQPDAQRGEKGGDQSGVDFEGIFYDQETVFGEFQDGD